MFWVSERGSHHLKLSWMSPFEINGVLTGYILSYREGIRLIVTVYTVSKKTMQNCFCQNYVKFSPILIIIIFWQKDGKEAKILQGALIFHLI